jgi:hypothetical protein
MISIICWKALRATASFSATKRLRNETALKNLFSAGTTTKSTVAVKK